MRANQDNSIAQVHFDNVNICQQCNLAASTACNPKNSPYVLQPLKKLAPLFSFVLEEALLILTASHRSPLNLSLNCTEG